MIMNTTIFEVVENFEKAIHSRISFAFSAVVKDLNSHLENVLTSTLNIADLLQETLKADLTKLTDQFLECSNGNISKTETVNIAPRTTHYSSHYNDNVISVAINTKSKLDHSPEQDR